MLKTKVKCCIHLRQNKRYMTVQLQKVIGFGRILLKNRLLCILFKGCTMAFLKPTGRIKNSNKSIDCTLNCTLKKGPHTISPEVKVTF